MKSSLQVQQSPADANTRRRRVSSSETCANVRHTGNPIADRYSVDMAAGAEIASTRWCLSVLWGFLLVWLHISRHLHSFAFSHRIAAVTSALESASGPLRPLASHLDNSCSPNFPKNWSTETHLPHGYTTHRKYAVHVSYTLINGVHFYTNASADSVAISIILWMSETQDVTNQSSSKKV